MAARDALHAAPRPEEVYDMPQIDRSREFVMLDFPRGARFTHYPSGDTCLRHEWMRGKDAQAWVDKVRDFLARHPKARTVCSGKWEVIDDLDDHPQAGGAFKVGDLVVTRREGFGEPDCVREIVAVREMDATVVHHEVDEVPRSFVLEDGEIMHWSTGNEGWFVDARNSDRDGRARRPLPGEDLARLAYPAEEMLRKACSEVSRRVLDLGNHFSLRAGMFPDAEDPDGAAEAFRQDLWAMAGEVGRDAEALSGHVKARDRHWRDAPLDPPDLAAVTERLVRCGELAAQALALPGAAGAGLHSLGMDLDGVVRASATVAETMRRRGVSEIVPAPAP